MFKVTVRIWFMSGVDVRSYSTPNTWNAVKIVLESLGIKYDILCYMELEELITL